MPHSPQRQADYSAKLDRFAELLSLDIPIPDIRQRMGLTKGNAYKLIADLRAKYGWQAQ
jgi:hypothetical protein